MAAGVLEADMDDGMKNAAHDTLAYLVSVTGGVEKAPPAQIAAEILDGVEGGVEEIFPGPMAAHFHRIFAADPKKVEKQFGGMLPPT